MYRINIKFKEVTLQLIVLFSRNIGDSITENHPVRLVNSIVDQLNIYRILELYKGGGKSSYYPLEHRSKQPIEPKAVFGQIKFNNKFNRFTLRGLEKVNVELGLLAISHNLRKIVSKIAGSSAKSPYILFSMKIYGIWLKF